MKNDVPFNMVSNFVQVDRVRKRLAGLPFRRRLAVNDDVERAAVLFFVQDVRALEWAHAWCRAPDVPLESFICGSALLNEALVTITSLDEIVDRCGECRDKV